MVTPQPPAALDRRDFLRTSAAAGIGLAALPRRRATALRDTELRVLSVGVVGTVGQLDRREVNSHPNARIVGLCDVDANHLQKAAGEHPDAFTCRDYREAFAKHADAFDAVIVATPDHSHAPILLTAFAHDKHVYGQKPLVQQLEELQRVDRALAAKPQLVTQLGNQRMVFPGRRAAVEILRQGQLGKAIAAYAWTGAPNGDYYFNMQGQTSAPKSPPEHLDWNLWLGPCEAIDYRDGFAPIRWRSAWEYGTNGLGDWGCHILDVIFFGFDELVTPIAVLTECAEAAGPEFHTQPCRSTITYAVDSERFASKVFPIHYSDSAQAPSRAALGLPPGSWGDANMTVVVCEGGVLTLTAGGKLEIWRDGRREDGMQMPNLPEFPKLNHWHAWVDNCLGTKTELRTPFKDAVRITEAALLAVKASRYPGEELAWDRTNLRFTNHEEATQTLVRRAYREGFAPPEVG